MEGRGVQEEPPGPKISEVLRWCSWDGVTWGKCHQGHRDFPLAVGLWRSGYRHVSHRLWPSKERGHVHCKWAQPYSELDCKRPVSSLCPLFRKCLWVKKKQFCANVSVIRITSWVPFPQLISSTGHSYYTVVNTVLSIFRFQCVELLFLAANVQKHVSELHNTQISQSFTEEISHEHIPHELTNDPAISDYKCLLLTKLGLHILMFHSDVPFWYNWPLHSSNCLNHLSCMAFWCSKMNLSSSSRKEYEYDSEDDDDEGTLGNAAKWFRAFRHCAWSCYKQHSGLLKDRVCTSGEMLLIIELSPYGKGLKKKT